MGVPGKTCPIIYGNTLIRNLVLSGPYTLNDFFDIVTIRVDHTFS